MHTVKRVGFIRMGLPSFIQRTIFPEREEDCHCRARVLFSVRDLVERESLSGKKKNVRFCLAPSYRCREKPSAEKDRPPPSVRT